MTSWTKSPPAAAIPPPRPDPPRSRPGTDPPPRGAILPRQGARSQHSPPLPPLLPGGEEVRRAGLGPQAAVLVGQLGLHEGHPTPARDDRGPTGERPPGTD